MGDLWDGSRRTPTQPRTFARKDETQRAKAGTLVGKLPKDEIMAAFRGVDELLPSERGLRREIHSQGATLWRAIPQANQSPAAPGASRFIAHA